MIPQAIITASALIVFSSTICADEPMLPPPDMKLKEPWQTLEKKDFAGWQVRKFVGMSGVVDGGSMAFEFITNKGIEFDVLVANPQYWTVEDKEKQRQVIYLIESGRFYLLVPGSKQEKHLINMLSRAMEALNNEDKESRHRLKTLLDTIDTRKAAKGDIFLTKEEIELNKQRGEQFDPDPFK